MEQLSKLAARRKRSSITRLTKNSKILKAITHAIREKKGENVILMDLRRVEEAVSDFFIVCEATSTVQVRAIADNVEEYLKKQLGETPYRHEGKQTAHWVLIDYVNVVVHVMQPEARKFYKLEEMWSDGEQEEL